MSEPTTPITFDPTPCGKAISTTLACGAVLTLPWGNSVVRCNSCDTLRRGIAHAFYRTLEYHNAWPAAFAMSATWAALLGRAADREAERLRAAARDALRSIHPEGCGYTQRVCDAIGA